MNTEKLKYKKVIMVDTIDNQWLEKIAQEYELCEDQTLNFQVQDPETVNNYPLEKELYEKCIEAGLEIGTWFRVIYTQ